MLNLFTIMFIEISKYETLMLQMIVLEKIYIWFVNKFILIYFNIWNLALIKLNIRVNCVNCNTFFFFLKNELNNLIKFY